jgi:hypothetical protein
LVCRKFLSPGCAPRKKIIFFCPAKRTNAMSFGGGTRKLKPVDPSYLEY